MTTDMRRADVDVKPGDLDQALADFRGEAATLRQHGQGPQALSIETVCDVVSECMRDYLTWLDEDDASLYTGRHQDTLARHFRELEARGMARWHRGRRQYRRQGLTHRGNAEAARAAGARAAGGRQHA